MVFALRAARGWRALLGIAGALVLVLPACDPGTVPSSQPTLECRQARVGPRDLGITFTIVGGPDEAYVATVTFGDGSAPEIVRDLRPGRERTVSHTYERDGVYVAEVSARNERTNDRYTCSTTNDVRPDGGCGSPMVFEDSFASDTGWRRTTVPSGSGFVDSAILQSSGGNPAGFRLMTHVLPGAGEIYVYHEYRGLYLPFSSGSVSRIRYSEDRIQLNPPAPGTAIAGGLWLSQNGQRWLAPLGTGEFRSTRWETATLELAAASIPLDLSDRGAPLSFGYYRANSTGGAPFTLTHGIDNWRLELCR